MINLKSIIKKCYCLLDMVSHNKNKHFSFIVKRSKIVSFGWNQPNKTHTMAAKFGYKFPYIHSELSAIKNFPHPNSHLDGLTLINVRIDKRGKINMAKPCKNCMNLIRFFGIRQVIYTGVNNWENMIVS